MNFLSILGINYCNEKLQKFFNHQIFKTELDLYDQENLKLGKNFTYADNTNVIKLIETGQGIFPLLDEQCALSSGSDLNFVESIYRANANSDCLIKQKGPMTSKFTIKHFASHVTYTSEHFLQKNQDKFFEDFPKLVKSSSTFYFLKRLFANTEQTVQGAKKKPKTLCFNFKVFPNPLSTFSI